MSLHLTIHNAITTGILTLVLCISHYLSPTIKRIKAVSTTQVVSFAAGVAVGYVFLHMLPALVESRDRIHQLLEHATVMSPFKDLIVFVIALFGFEIYYLLERYTMERKLSDIATRRRAYALNVGFYFLYNFLITYTLMLRLEGGDFYAVLFTVAMGLHFVLTDRHFKRYYPKLFNRQSHIYLLLALILGYVLSLLIPVNVYVDALLTAFLSGSVLYVAFSEEIALNRQTSMRFFFSGSAIMAGLLAFLLVR